MRECFNNIRVRFPPHELLSLSLPGTRVGVGGILFHFLQRKINDFLTLSAAAHKTNCENSEIYFLPYIFNTYNACRAPAIIFSSFRLWDATLALKTLWSSLVSDSSWYLSARCFSPSIYKCGKLQSVWQFSAFRSERVSKFATSADISEAICLRRPKLSSFKAFFCCLSWFVIATRFTGFGWLMGNF